MEEIIELKNVNLVQNSNAETFSMLSHALTLARLQVMGANALSMWLPSFITHVISEPQGWQTDLPALAAQAILYVL